MSDANSTSHEGYVTRVKDIPAGCYASTLKITAEFRRERYERTFYQINPLDDTAQPLRATWPELVGLDIEQLYDDSARIEITHMHDMECVVIAWEFTTRWGGFVEITADVTYYGTAPGNLERFGKRHRETEEHTTHVDWMTTQRSLFFEQSPLEWATGGLQRALEMWVRAVNDCGKEEHVVPGIGQFLPGNVIPWIKTYNTITADERGEQ